MNNKRLKKRIIGYLIPLIAVLVSYFVLPHVDFDITENDGSLPVNVYFIDVGQGDAALIDVDGEFVMIDGGTDSSAAETVDFIKSLGVETFNSVIATHPHEDHIGGLDDIVNTFGAKTAYISSGETTTRTFENLLYSLENTETEILSASDRFSVGDAEFEVFAPLGDDYKELNNYSLCIKMTVGERSFLFTGDAEKLSENEMLNGHFDLDSDVLKVGHHGSETSSSKNFLDAVSPKIAVISVGRNSYGLPDESVTEELSAGCKLYRTDNNGTVIVSTDGKELAVSCDYN